MNSYVLLMYVFNCSLVRYSYLTYYLGLETRDLYSFTFLSPAVTGLMMLALVFLASGLFSSILLACLSHYLPNKSTEERHLEHQ